MSIANATIYLKRLETITLQLAEKYQANQLASLEFKKLLKDTKILTDYLSHVDRLKPTYHSDHINDLMKAIVLHLDILKVEIEKKDFVKLQHGTTIIKTMLKFHPSKYSALAFVTAWLLEWLYFI